MLMLPWFILLLVGGSIFGLRVVLEEEGESEEEEKNKKRLKQRSMKLINTLVFLMYPGLGLKAFRVFKCKDVDGIFYLQADMNIICGEGEHLVLSAAAIVFIVLYVIGIPAAYIAVMFPHRHWLANEKEVADPRAGLSVDITHPKYLEMKKTYGQLFLQYENRCWW